MSAAVFHKKLLKNYQIVTKPGTYLVSVACNITKDNYYDKDDYPRYILPLRVITPINLQKVVTFLEHVPTVPYDLVKDCFMTGALFINDNDYLTTELPFKGEQVMATFDYVDEVLRCTNIELLPREELEYINILDFGKFENSIINLLKNERHDND